MSQKIKILHIYKSYYSDGLMGGVEEMIHQLSSAHHLMQNKNIQVQHRILTLAKNITKPIRKDKNGAEIYSYKNQFEMASTPFSLPFLWDLKRHLEWADIVHYHFPWPFGDLAYFWGKLFFCNKPSLVTYHSDIVKQRILLKLYAPLQFFFLKKIDKIVATSQNYAQTSPVLQRFSEKISIIPLGIEAIDPPSKEDKKLQKWKKKLGNNFYLFIGALRYYKGLHLAFQALPPNINLVIAGAGNEEKNLKALAKKLGLQKQIHFIGKITNQDKWALLKLAKAFLFPSHLRSEAFGISLIEAAMMDKPMISCEIGTGTSFVNKDHETGLVVEPTPQAIKAALLYFEKHPAMLKKWGANAKARYKKYFTAQKMIKSYHQLYEELAK